MMDERLARYSSLLDPATVGEASSMLAADGWLPEPERKLMFAVLVDAITEKDAWWVAGVGGLGPFTFENVCEPLGFDRERLAFALLAAFAADAALRRPRRQASAAGCVSAQRLAGRARRLALA